MTPHIRVVIYKTLQSVSDAKTANNSVHSSSTWSWGGAKVQGNGGGAKGNTHLSKILRKFEID